MVKFLDASDALNVPTESTWIVDKADAHITNLEDLLEQARASSETSAVNNEQLYHQLESRFVNLRKEHELACQQRDTLVKTQQTLQSSKETAAGQTNALTTSNITLSTQLRQRENKINILEEQAKSAAEKAERQQIRLDKLDNELALQSTQLITNSKQELHLTQQLDEAQRDAVPLKMENSRLTSEVQTLTKQNQQFNESMQEQTEKMLELSKSKNTIEYELRSETDRLETERISLEKDLNSEKGRVQELGKKLNDKNMEFKTLKR
tara:strand:- start:437 stop:1234 length:798 start_codon:yes stop_codon:yes gene_type:complete